MASVAPVSLTIELPDDVAGLLKKAASDRGWTPETLAAECIAQQLEVAVRHRVALERIDQVDGAILELAKAIGTIEAGSEGIDLADFCRYGKRG